MPIIYIHIHYACVYFLRTFRGIDYRRVQMKLTVDYTCMCVWGSFSDLNDGSCASIYSVDAAYRSHREEQSLKRRGKSNIKQKKKRRHERKLRVRRLEY